MEKNKIYIKSYGCQMNVYDSNRILDLFKNKNYEKVEDPKDANLVVLNTCHIREKAAEKVYSDIGRINKKTNLAFGAFYNQTLVSFIFGDVFNIEKISEYEILLIYVCKDFRKKGLGTKLLNKIEENNTRLKKIYLEVSKNNFEGISFYTKMKFIGTHTRKNYFFIKNNYIDALAMVKTY